MPQQQNPVALGAHRAGNDCPKQASFTRTIPETQAFERRLRRRQHLVRQLHRLGARVVFELLDELGRHHGIDADLDRQLERYAALDPLILAGIGGDRFARLPMRIVGGVR